VNNDLRLEIVQMVKRSGEGHIPSSFSIVDIIDYIYGNELRYDRSNLSWKDRDYFILSKGHGCAALYVVLRKYGVLSDRDIENYGTAEGILGGHPDATRIPGVEASTGSLGHGFPSAVGLALGLRIRDQNNRVFVLVGDGECHEGTVWEAAHVANNLELGNLCVIVDWNDSAAQLMPKDDLPAKWKAFGWNTIEMDGHSTKEYDKVFSGLSYSVVGKPTVIIAHNIKGKGVSFIEGHGPWHHRVPSDEEMILIAEELVS